MSEYPKTRKSGDKKTTDYDFMLEIAGNNEMDLREYTEKVKDELKSIEDYCITDYMAVNKDVAVLYEELGKSNDILDRIENIVSKFQTKLGSIADDVSKLQDKSNKYNIALNNRRDFESELHNFLDGILLSPQLVKDLISNDIDLRYLEKLEEFNKILKNVAEATKTAPDSQAIKDVIEEIEKLTIQVCHKIRSFLLSMFYKLHKDKTNFQIIQQNSLIRYKSLNQFLRSHSKDKYIEITNQYAEYMSKRYYNDLKDYSTEVAKMVKERITKNDVVIIDEYKYKASTDAKSGVNPLDLEDREAILNDIDAEPIVPHHMNSATDKISFEEAFRSKNTLLINLITTEYSFVLEFFDLKASQCDFIFNTIFSKIVNYFLDWLSTACEASYDVISILMIVLIKSEFKAVMKERKIYILDYYFDKIEIEMWPRFTTVFDHFLQNIKNAKPKNFKLYNLSVHYTSQRYVSLVLMLYKIASKTGHNMLLSRLSQMQSNFIKFIENLAETSFTRAQDRKNKLFFLVNNIHYIYSSIANLHLDIELKDLEKLEGIYTQEVSDFINNTLQDQYSNMVAIVNEFAPAGDSDSSGDEETKEHAEHHLQADNIKNIDKKKIEMIAQEFNMVFRDKIDMVIKTVKDNAYSDKISKHILGKFMRILIFKYSTFLEIVKISHPSFFREAMSSHHILLELKNISIDVAKD